MIIINDNMVAKLIKYLITDVVDFKVQDYTDAYS